MARRPAKNFRLSEVDLQNLFFIKEKNGLPSNVSAIRMALRDSVRRMKKEVELFP